jgi:hypothetical protein
MLAQENPAVGANIAIYGERSTADWDSGGSELMACGVECLFEFTSGQEYVIARMQFF